VINLEKQQIEEVEKEDKTLLNNAQP
jgi:hypothetical protein